MVRQTQFDFFSFNIKTFLKRDFLDFLVLFSTFFNTASYDAPSDSTVSEDAGIEPRTVATTVLAVRRSNHSANPLFR
jgi:hypothetical protein